MGVLLSQALEAFSLLSRTEGIIPALETSHAIAHLEVYRASTRPGEDRHAHAARPAAVARYVCERYALVCGRLQAGSGVFRLLPSESS